jgi:hypothetical protein
MNVIFLDGFLGNHRRWLPCARVLEARGARVRIWDYDTSGFTALFLGNDLPIVCNQRKHRRILLGTAWAGL